MYGISKYLCLTGLYSRSCSVFYDDNKSAIAAKDCLIPVLISTCIGARSCRLLYTPCTNIVHTRPRSRVQRNVTLSDNDARPRFPSEKVHERNFFQKFRSVLLKRRSVRYSAARRRVAFHLFRVAVLKRSLDRYFSVCLANTDIAQFYYLFIESKRQSE